MKPKYHVKMYFLWFLHNVLKFLQPLLSYIAFALLQNFNSAGVCHNMDGYVEYLLLIEL